MSKKAAGLKRRKGMKMEGFGIMFLLIVVLVIVLACVTSKQEKEKNDTLRMTVVKTKFIDSSHTATSTSRTKAGSAAARGLVGGALLGPVGLVAGAASGKKKTKVVERHTTTFMVYYSNGTRKVETVSNESSQYQIYMNKLEMD